MWPSSVSAAPWYTPYWGIDGVYTYTTSSEVIIPTGYWWGNSWDGYGPYNGWVSTSSYPYPWLDGWSVPVSCYPGFADLDYYDWGETRTVYKYSYYWNRRPFYDDQGVLDITAFAGPNGLEPLQSADTQWWSFGRIYPYHIWAVDYGDPGALLTGSFAPLAWVQDDATDITNYLLSDPTVAMLDNDPADIADFLASPAMNYLLSQGGPGTYIGLEEAVVPEPTSLALVAAGALGLMMRVRRSSK
jgi:hypothetical protein